MAVIVTGHAIMRWQERIENVSEDEARRAMSGPVVELANIIGAPYVRLGTGHRIVLEDGHVVTVLPKEVSAKKRGRRMERRASRAKS